MMVEHPTRIGALLVSLVFLLTAPGAFAAAAPDAGPRAATKTYPGTLTIQVDLTQAPRHIYAVHETIPVSPGSVTILFPKWVLPNHRPDGPISNIVGLQFKANGEKLVWRRDLEDMYAFHVAVPDGVEQLQLDYHYVAAGPDARRGYPAWSNAAIVDLAFYQVAFYPAGYPARAIPIKATVKLPAGWDFASALEVAERDADTIHFKRLAFNDLIDSPLVAGKHVQHVDLTPPGGAPVHMDLFGDEPAVIAMSKAQKTGFRSAVKQLHALFQSRHYAHYNLLTMVSDYLPGDGLEHKQSSDNRLPADFLRDADRFASNVYSPIHEMIHSWNGTFRRPRDMWRPAYNKPQHNDLIWVYEGLTQYLAGVITARAGLWTPAQYRAWLASRAALMAHRTGRSWRSLQDVADASLLQYHNGDYWFNYKRRTDFYPEGVLLWLDVDTKIRALSHDDRSLDDFAQAFFGMHDGSRVTSLYTFADVVAVLNKVQAFDWKHFLRKRLDYTGPDLPYRGLARGGWKLAYASDAAGVGVLAQGREFAYSIGLTLTDGGRVQDVQWQGPAFQAGFYPGVRILSVNGRDYSRDLLHKAVRASAQSGAKIHFVVHEKGRTQQLTVTWQGGLKYPVLSRRDGVPDRVAATIQPLPYAPPAH